MILYFFIWVLLGCNIKIAVASPDSPSSLSSSPVSSRASTSSFGSSSGSIVSRSSWNSLSTEPGEQLQNSVELVYSTLFQDLHFLDTVGLGKYESEILEQSQLLRRLYLLFLLGNLEYKVPSGKSEPWPFPLASVLTQGQRILIILDGIKIKEFLNFLTNSNSKLFYKRKFSSHGIRLNPETGEIEEIKIKTPFRRFKKEETVLGLDFPFGGVGAELPDGSRVGPRGWELVGKKLNKSKQLGHLHLYAQYFPEIDKTAVLIGIESCAPGSSNQIGCNHNILSGLKNQKMNRSVSGGTKWGELDLSAPSPAEYGGKTIHIAREQFDHHNIKYQIDQIVLHWQDLEQAALFRELLKLDAVEGMKVLRKTAPKYFWG